MIFPRAHSCALWPWKPESPETSSNTQLTLPGHLLGHRHGNLFLASVSSWLEKVNTFIWDLDSGQFFFFFSTKPSSLKKHFHPLNLIWISKFENLPIKRNHSKLFSSIMCKLSKIPKCWCSEPAIMKWPVTPSLRQFQYGSLVSEMHSSVSHSVW